MLSVHADRLLRTMGKEPAPQGIVEVADLPAAIAAIEAAVAKQELAQGQEHDEPTTAPDQKLAPDTVSLRQRAWPLLEVMRRAHAADSDIVWEV